MMRIILQSLVLLDYSTLTHNRATVMHTRVTAGTQLLLLLLFPSDKY